MSDQRLIRTASFMSDIAIRVEHLSKLYTIGALQQRHDTLRDAISDFRQRAPQFRALRIADALRRPNPQSEDLWALKDVSFEVKPGEVVGTLAPHCVWCSAGVIGRNGAGTSTLFRILSRITEPTGGRFATPAKRVFRA